MFAGLISIAQPTTAWGNPDKILAALAPYSLDKPRDFWATDLQMLLQVATQNGSITAKLYRHPESGVAVAFWGRLDNRSDLIAQLEGQHKASDDELIALAWLKWGEYCPEKLLGDFAFAVACPKTGMVFLARDVMGVKPLFYRADKYGVFFATSAAAFKPLALGVLTPSHEWMAKFMLGLSYSQTETAYLEINKLACANCLLIFPDGRSKLRRYHQFIDDAPIEKSYNNKWLEAYQSVWQEAVSCRMPAGEKIAVENSGGLDSGSITAEIARQLNGDIDRLHGTGYCFEPLEPQYIMANAMKWGMNNNMLFSGGDSEIASLLYQRECIINGYPNEHSNGSAHYLIYQYCQQNDIRVLNSGFGGDEVVTSQASPIRAELFDRGDLLGLWRTLPGSPPLKAGRFAKTIYNSFNKKTFSPWLIKSWRERWQHHFIQAGIVEKYALKKKYFDSATYDEQFRTVNQFALSRLSEPFVSTRLENCTLMASSYGLDYVWPLLDQRLIQQWLSTPSIWKVGKGGTGRYLHRKAISGVCADLVTWKNSKDMGYSAATNELELVSNRKKFQSILEMTEVIPGDLIAVLDIPKARAMAQAGINEDWRGAELHTALFLYASKLESMNIWLSKK